MGKRIDLINHLESYIGSDGLLICESGYKEPVRLFPQYYQTHQSLGFPVEMDFSNGWQLEGDISVNNIKMRKHSHTSLPIMKPGWTMIQLKGR